MALSWATVLPYRWLSGFHLNRSTSGLDFGTCRCLHTAKNKGYSRVLWLSGSPISCGRFPRRLLIGGVFWNFVGMAEEGSSFTASARPRTSQVEEVLKNVEWPEKFPYKDQDFQRFDECFTGGHFLYSWWYASLHTSGPTCRLCLHGSPENGHLFQQLPSWINGKWIQVGSSWQDPPNGTHFLVIRKGSGWNEGLEIFEHGGSHSEDVKDLLCLGKLA